MRDRIRWMHFAIVASLAVGAAAAQCGHDSADGEESGAEASAESPGEKEAESGESESSEAPEGRDEGMIRSKAQRIANPDVDRKSVEKLVSSNTSFGLDLYAELVASKSDENLFYSPYNLSHVLAMVLPGARGETRAEMRKTLGYRLDEPKLHAAFNMLESALRQSNSSGPKGPGGGKGEEKPDILRTADAVWSQRGLALEDPYLETLARHYGTGVRPVDFEASPEKARSSINDWAAERTEGKIEDLLPSGAVDNRTRLVLTAAIYFRAQWASTFDENATEKADFHPLSGSKSEVEMMYQKLRDGYRYAEGAKWRAVGLPYASGSYSMVVVLPDEGAFAEVESKFDAEFVESLFESLERAPVDLALPKFELTSRFSAASALGKLGMKRPFTKSADFSGMTDEQKLVLDDVLHKAYVSVDEKGTEAAAASAAAMRATSLPAGEPDYEKVTVDRPFLFMIRHEGTGTVLFAGRVVSL